MAVQEVVAVRESAQYATTAHGIEQYHDEGYVTRWGDFIDTTIATRFKLAMIRLEELLYAIYGARPQYAEGATDGLWYKRPDPRCLWPEQVKYTDYMDFATQTIISGGWKEYAAYGASWKGDCPTVPKKSRSGDPDYQFRRVDHAIQAPYGSITRTVGAEVYDPRSTKYDSGTPVVAGEVVTITYTPPVDLKYPIAHAYLHSNVAATVEMTPSGDHFYATIAKQAQNTIVKWYVRILWYDTEAETNDWCYDPHGATGVKFAPATPDPPEKPHYRGLNDAYTYVQFTHYNQYEHGLPEFLHWYDQQWRKNCDSYEFTPDEKIQVGLINLCRWTLDYLGARLHHPPRVRGPQGQNDTACCFYMPITWLWSGANAQGHYVSGGKIGTTPLFSRPGEEIDSDDASVAEQARMTWRGVPRVFDETPYHMNQTYGGDESWLAEPEAFFAEYGYDPSYPPEGEYGFHYWLEAGRAGRGLREGDVIDAVHIEEIIAAIDYLVRYGVWTYTDICRLPLTPGTFVGYTCGYYWSSEDPAEQWQRPKCCEDYVENSEGGIQDGWCTPWSKPTWQECTDDCLNWVCSLEHRWDGTCSSTSGAAYSYGTDCDVDTPTGVNCGYGSSYVQCSETAGSGVVNELVRGWSAYVCGPSRTKDGPDDLHGNGFIKTRMTHGYPPDDRTIGAKMGNRFGAVDACAEFIGEVGVDDDFDFEVVTPARWTCAASHWIQHKSCSAPVPCDYDDLSYYEGLPGWKETNRSYVVSGSYTELAHCNAFDAFISGAHRFAQGCRANMPDPHICNDNKTWVAIELNVDDTGAPYGDHESYSSDGDGQLIPKLYPYEMPQPTGGQYVESPDNCPCETVENPTLCT